MRDTLRAIMAGALVFASALSVEAGPRDLARYETLGPYVLHERVLTAADRALVDSQMRDFLLRCWQQHRLGRLITLRFSIEGLPTRTTYYIEPDASGGWHVVVESLGTLPGTKPGTNEHYTEQQARTATLTSVQGPDGKEHVRVVSGKTTLLDL